LTNFCQFQLNVDNFAWLDGYLVTSTHAPRRTAPDPEGRGSGFFSFSKQKGSPFKKGSPFCPFRILLETPIYRLQKSQNPKFIDYRSPKPRLQKSQNPKFIDYRSPKNPAFYLFVGYLVTTIRTPDEPLRPRTGEAGAAVFIFLNGKKGALLKRASFFAL
jgi:hypothetical protein